MALTVRSLLVMCGAGALLAVLASVTQRRDIELATGPSSASQESFFINAADRPDINTFFQKLTPAQKLAMSSNIGRYSDAVLAKLCAKLLSDFDPRARTALTNSLAKVAQAHPEAVAVELKEQGSFQELGVIQALRTLGPPAIPLVAKQLSVTDARPNAVDYLGGSGPEAVPIVLTYLQSPDQAVRIAAAEVLGQLRAKEAVEPLTQMLASSKDTEKTDALSAISEIADPSSEPLLTGILSDSSQTAALRIQAALGLGRIGTASAATKLWKLAGDYDLELRQGIYSALVLCPDVALASPGPTLAMKLQVAKRVNDAAADAIVRQALQDPALQAAGAEAAIGRPSVVPTLTALLRQPPVAANGDVAEPIIDALSSTPTGDQVLAGFESNARLAGFIARRSSLGPVNPESE